MKTLKQVKAVNPFTIQVHSLQLTVIANPFVDDYDSVTRTWKERLFTLPWQPWVSTKVVYNPKAFFISEGTIICSPRTAEELRNGNQERS
jgi:hypothetical protein